MQACLIARCGPLLPYAAAALCGPRGVPSCECFFIKNLGPTPINPGPEPCRIYRGRPTVGGRGGPSFPQDSPPAPPTPGIFTIQGRRTPPPFPGSLPRPGDLHYPEAFVRGGAPGDLHYPRSGTYPRPPSSHPPFPPGFVFGLFLFVLSFTTGVLSVHRYACSTAFFKNLETRKRS